MISYAWRDELSRAERSEVDDLLAQAVVYDEEAGFSTADPRADAPGEGFTRHLLVTTLLHRRAYAAPGETPAVPLAAYLRVDVCRGAGDVQLVVHPGLRSHGIATLLLERLAAEPCGWAAIPGLRELRAWAHGSHPTAHRARSRRGAVVSGTVFKTLRPVGGPRPCQASPAQLARLPASSPPAEISPGHQRAMAPADRATLARASLLLRPEEGGGGILVGVDARDPAAFPACVALTGGPGLSPAELATLLGQGLREVQLAGARVAQLYVDALDSRVVQAARELGFEHDQSDCRYVLGVREIPAGH